MNHPDEKGNIDNAKDRGDDIITLDFTPEISTVTYVDGERFDWDKRFTVRLAPVEVMEIIRVFKGEQESLNNGKGIYIQKDNSTLEVRHHIVPVPRFSIVLKTTEKDGATSTRRISLTPIEAKKLGMALSKAIKPKAGG